ncbi:hypothetical protein GCM10008965_42000 [Methylorubrum aminovorans]|nr:hypothetical protein GCM10025880_45600 [Methylorubrum aminovorans]
MSRQAASHGDLSSAPEAETICERIYMLLQCIHDTNEHNKLENEIVVLVNELMSVTRAYDVLFLYLHDSLIDLNFGKALQVGKLLLQHGAVLNSIASESFIGRPGLLN